MYSSSVEFVIFMMFTMKEVYSFDMVLSVPSLRTTASWNYQLSEVFQHYNTQKVEQKMKQFSVKFLFNYQDAAF